MNVAFVLNSLSERYGGPSRTALGMGAGLRRLNVSVSYWVTGDEKDRQEASVYGPSVHVCDVSWPRSWLRSKDLVQSLGQCMSAMDLIHAYGLWLHPALAAAKIARKSDTPYLLCPIGALVPWRLHRKFLKKRLYLSLIGKRIMQGAACLHAASPMEAESFRLAGHKGPVTIVPRGVDTEAFTDLPDSQEAEEEWPVLRNRPVVLFLSRLSPEKGLDLLIRAWADIRREGRYADALLVIAGPDDRGYGAKIKPVVMHEGVQSSILFTGMVKGRKKLALYRRADIFVLPSYAENFGIVIAEAMASGTPVITTTGTPWKEIEDVDAGRWVSSDRGAVHDALRELLDLSEAERRAMGERGRKLVFEKYSWESVARKMLKVYKAILGGVEIPVCPTAGE